MTTSHDAAQIAEYDALTGEQRALLWDGGNVAGIPVRCDYCDNSAAWAVQNGPRLRIACSTAVHMAWVSSNGSAVPVSDITRANGYPVDEATRPVSSACGCPVYAENDGRFTTEHEAPCSLPPVPAAENPR